MKKPTSRQLYYLQKNNIAFSSDMSRNMARLEIKSHIEKIRKVEVNKIEYASLKLKRILERNNIKFNNDIERKDALELLSNIGYEIGQNDEIISIEI